MQRERKQIRGILSLGTLLRVSLVSGLAMGLMFGVFAGVVSLMGRGSVIDLILFVAIGPPAIAVLLMLVTLIGHPLYAALGRLGIPGLDKLVYEVSGN
jgi:hypothetical protein